MLGRGILSNPMLVNQIKNGSENFNREWIPKFRSLHDNLLASATEKLSGDKHILLKMNGYWEYFNSMFTTHKKELKQIKKVKKLGDYEAAVQLLLNSALKDE